MRQLKFRVWNKEQKKMFYPGDDFIEGEKSFICLNLFGTPINAYSESGSDRIFNLRFAITEDEFELMQFTGLHDKNGKEIYAGDILINIAVQNSDYIAKPHLVDWANAHEYCGFVARTFNQDIGELFLNKNFRNCEIIGNIHETPELLKD